MHTENRPHAATAGSTALARAGDGDRGDAGGTAGQSATTGSRCVWLAEAATGEVSSVCPSVAERPATPGPPWADWLPPRKCRANGFGDGLGNRAAVHGIRIAMRSQGRAVSTSRICRVEAAAAIPETTGFHRRKDSPPGSTGIAAALSPRTPHGRDPRSGWIFSGGVLGMPLRGSLMRVSLDR